MKTAIFIPDELFKVAEQFARQSGLSRSALYATALRLYLEDRRHEDVTERLNAVYSKEQSALDPVIAQMQLASLSKDEW